MLDGARTKLQLRGMVNILPMYHGGGVRVALATIRISSFVRTRFTKVMS